jgi:Putative NADH-flavin reductase
MARIAIIGAHGKVAQQLMRLLYDSGDEFVGVVRDPEQTEDVYRFGGDGVLLDIEDAAPEQLAAVLTGCDAVVFSAGAGAGSGVGRKRTVDYEGSVKSAAAAQQAGVRRFIQVSAMGVDSPVTPDADETWAAYVQAKRDADLSLRQQDLDWTILRPGSLTLDEGTGRVRLGETVPRGSIPRADVAALIVAVLNDPRTIGWVWEATSGDTPIPEAIASLVG